MNTNDSDTSASGDPGRASGPRETSAHPPYRCGAWCTHDDEIEAAQRAASAGVAGPLNTSALLAALEEIERHCPCGARPESPTTHHHVIGCPVETALNIVRSVGVAGPPAQEDLIPIPSHTAGENTVIMDRDGIYRSDPSLLFQKRRPFSELRAQMSPESQARAAQRTADMLKDPAVAEADLKREHAALLNIVRRIADRLSYDPLTATWHVSTSDWLAQPFMFKDFGRWLKAELEARASGGDDAGRRETKGSER